MTQLWQTTSDMDSNEDRKNIDRQVTRKICETDLMVSQN